MNKKINCTLGIGLLDQTIRFDLDHDWLVKVKGQKFQKVLLKKQFFFKNLKIMHNKASTHINIVLKLQSGNFNSNGDRAPDVTCAMRPPEEA